MKLDTFITLSKGFTAVLIGVFTPWTAALAQWVGSDQWPSRIVWVGVILPASVIGGASAWRSFTSSSWPDYMKRQGALTETPAPAIVAPVETVKPNP